METTTKPGEWSVFVSKIDEQAQKAFDVAIKKIIGVNYSPVAVSQQIVKGINYRFFCNSQVVYPNSLHGAAIVSIYWEPNGIPCVTSIMPIHL